MARPQGKLTKSPLKRAPLHNPGESVQQEIDRLLDSTLVPTFWAAAVAVIFAVQEWWRFLTDSRPQPVAMTLFAAAALFYFAWRFVRLKRQVAALKLGRDGEKSVGQFLEAMRADGHQVFHDVPCGGFNIDHIVVGPHGVFAIETKTFSKPVRGQPRATYDGHDLTVGGRKPDRNPIDQAKGSAAWVRDYLKESTSRSFLVRAVVLLPGWYVESTPGAHNDVWVLNPKAFPAFAAKSKTALSPEDVALVASRLTLHVTS